MSRASGLILITEGSHKEAFDGAGVMRSDSLKDDSAFWVQNRSRVKDKGWESVESAEMVRVWISESG